MKCSETEYYWSWRERLKRGKVDGLVSEAKPDKAILEMCLNKSKLVYSPADIRERTRSTNSLIP